MVYIRLNTSFQERKKKGSSTRALGMAISLKNVAKIRTRKRRAFFKQDALHIMLSLTPFSDMTQEERVTNILRVMKDVEQSSLSVNEYVKEHAPPFGREQSYVDKKTLRERGIAGLYDQRSRGNHLKCTREMKLFVKGLLEYQRSMSS